MSENNLHDLLDKPSPDAIQQDSDDSPIDLLDTDEQPSATSLHYAGFWKRLLAESLDLIIFISIAAPIFLPLQFWCLEYKIVFPLVLFIIFLQCIHLFLIVQYGGTPGKFILGLRIIDNKLNNLSWGAAIKMNYFFLIGLIIQILRFYTAIHNYPYPFEPDTFWEANSLLTDARMNYGGIYAPLSEALIIPGVISFGVILFNQKKRALYDFIAGSYVVTRKSLLSANNSTESPIILDDDKRANTILVWATCALILLAFGVFFINKSYLEANSYYMQGIKDMNTGKVDKAIEAFSEAIKKQPELVDAYINRGILYTKQRKHDVALKDFDYVLEKKYANAQLYAYFALIWSTEGHYDNAARFTDFALQKDPDNIQAQINLGIIATAKEEYDKAFDCFNKVIAQHPDNSGAFYYRGRAYSQKGQYNKAIEDYNTALRLDPSDPYIYHARGTVYFKQGKYGRAIEDYSAALVIDPNDPYNYNGRGNAYGEIGQYEKAIADYTQGLAISDSKASDVLLYYNRCLTHCDYKHYDEAISDCKKVIRINPNKLVAYYRLGVAYQYAGQKDSAIQSYKEYIRLTPYGDRLAEKAKKKIKELNRN